ncbi:hypothetical protein ACFUC1_16315 [Pedococcus sp. NPDC057267]|uniref:hypothetical protein n=1 Tax=Pedococcus sp. NPDC057267 TaxID=3346077 RepID=UPI0036290D99
MTAPGPATATPATPTPTGFPGPGILRGAATGLVLGVLWGVAARVFMRLVADAPEFSWAGTLGILAIAAWFGAWTGAAAGAVRAGRRGWWCLLAVPALILFAGQGAPFLPGALLGALALSRRLGGRGDGRGDGRRWVAVVAAVAANLVAPFLLWRSDRLDEVTMLSAPLRAQVATLVLMPLLGLALAWWGRDLFAPRSTRRRWAQSASPDRARSSRRNESSLAAPAGPA